MACGNSREKSLSIRINMLTLSCAALADEIPPPKILSAILSFAIIVQGLGDLGSTGPKRQWSICRCPKLYASNIAT